jgi:hypothetical protein
MRSTDFRELLDSLPSLTPRQRDELLLRFASATRRLFGRSSSGLRTARLPVPTAEKTA